jgi:putative transposase
MGHVRKEPTVEMPAVSYRCHRYPAEIIAQCVRLYYRFPLSYRGVEELMFERGVVVSYESIRRWCFKFGPAIALGLRERRPRPNGKWHLDEMHVRMNGRTYYLWRAVDADGMVLDILVQDRRNREAAERFLRRLMERYPEGPRAVVTDKLASYGPAIKAVVPRAEHRSHKGLNNRAENSHQPTRQRERARRRFRSPEQAQRFLEPFGPIREHFCPGPGQMTGASCGTIFRVCHPRRFVIDLAHGVGRVTTGG